MLRLILSVFTPEVRPKFAKWQKVQQEKEARERARSNAKAMRDAEEERRIIAEARAEREANGNRLTQMDWIMIGGTALVLLYLLEWVMILTTGSTIL